MTETDPRPLDIKDLGVRYAGRRERALAGVTLDVPAGEILGVEGRTGAGKSTLALAAAGFIPRVVRATMDGSVRLGGVSTAGTLAGELADRVGIVFSTPANQLSASKLTVREELAFGLENLGIPRETMDARIDEVLDHLGIAHLGDREPFALSGGEQQRVAIASIVAMGTSVVVLDEPTAQLDPAGVLAVANLLRGLATGGRAILCVEHAQTVLALVDRCLVLEAGRVVTIDRPGAALGSPVLQPLGLRAPPLVALAELADLPADIAFDEERIAAALALESGARLAARLADAASGRGAQATEGAADGQAAFWDPIRNERPVAVAVSGLVHRYPGGIEAVRGVDLSIDPGRSVAIVGQNGSGKTTLVKHLNGLLRPHDGVVEIGGHDIADDRVNVIACTVGFVFQNPDEQLFNRSVEREVGFGPRNLRLDHGTSALLVEQALRLTGLTSERAVNPYDLGFSTRKLVALASVLAMAPQVLVLDEPTTGQDGPGVALVGAIVDAFHAAGRTVIAITHDMEFAAAHFERIVVMRDGQVIADGAPAETFAPERRDLLASTGLVPPTAARIGARLGLGSTPTERALVEALAARPGGVA